MPVVASQHDCDQQFIVVCTLEASAQAVDKVTMQQKVKPRLMPEQHQLVQLCHLV